MSATTAVENLKLALKDIKRDTRRVKVHPNGRREEFGEYAQAQAGDVVAACDLARPPEKDQNACRIVRDLRKGSEGLPPETAVMVWADDLYCVLDHVTEPASVDREESGREPGKREVE